MQKEITHLVPELDRSGKFSWKLFKKMGEAELLGIPFPKEYGGAGVDTLCYSIAVEEVSRICGSKGLFFCGSYLTWVLPNLDCWE